jgi:hypothetical protein
LSDKKEPTQGWFIDKPLLWENSPPHSGQQWNCIGKFGGVFLAFIHYSMRDWSSFSFCSKRKETKKPHGNIGEKFQLVSHRRLMSLFLRRKAQP